jgi:tetratricopeptide (TPR) repeat protein
MKPYKIKPERPIGSCFWSICLGTTTGYAVSLLLMPNTQPALARPPLPSAQAVMLTQSLLAQIPPATTSAEAVLNQGVAKHRQRDFRAAIAEYSRAIQLKPDLTLAYVYRASAHRSLGELPAAVTDLDQAIRLNAKDANVFNNRGLARAELGQDLQGAIADYDQALKLDPNLAITYNNRGLARAKIGDQQGAVADLQQAAQLAQTQGNQSIYELATQNLKEVQR